MKTENLQKLSTAKAIGLWNKFALVNTSELTIGHNPSLFFFFKDFKNLKPYYFLLSHDDEIFGLLPLVLCGKKIISIPHFSHGGLLRLSMQNSSLSDEKLISLPAGLIETNNLDAGFYQLDFNRFDRNETAGNHAVEIRQTTPLFGKLLTEKVLHTIPLKKNYHDQLALFDSSLRRKINKSKKNGIELKTGTNDLLEDFTFVYNKNMHKLGSPTLGKSFFEKLCNSIPKSCEITVAYLNEKPIGGGFCIWYNGFYENTWFSTLQKFNHLYTSYALHNSMIENAIGKNAHTYSLGRSTKNSGVHQYKLQWPVEEKELWFNSNLEKGYSLKDQKWLTKIWKVLPERLVNFVGPYVARRIY